MLLLRGRPEDGPAVASLCQALARLIKTCSATNHARRFPDFGKLRDELAGIARAYLGIELSAGGSDLKTLGSMDLLKRGLVLVWLRDTQHAARLLMQAALRFPQNPLVTSFARRFVNQLETRKVLDFAWQHAKLGVRTAGWWPWMLAAVAAYAALVYESPEAGFVKACDSVLALVLAVEAYVNFLSGQNVEVLGIGIAGVCGVLYSARWVWTPAHLTWGHEWRSLLAALGAWGCFVSLILVVHFSKQSRNWRHGLPLGALRILLPVLLFLGGARAFLFLGILIPVVAVFDGVSRLLGHRLKERLSKDGIQVQDRDVSQALAVPDSTQFLVCAVIVMLYGQTLLDWLGLVIFLIIVMLFVVGWWNRLRGRVRQARATTS